MCPQLTVPPEGQHGDQSNSNGCRTLKEIFLLDHINVFHSNCCCFQCNAYGRCGKTEDFGGKEVAKGKF